MQGGVWRPGISDGQRYPLVARRDIGQFKSNPVALVAMMKPEQIGKVPSGAHPSAIIEALHVDLAEIDGRRLRSLIGVGGSWGRLEPIDDLTRGDPGFGLFESDFPADLFTLFQAARIVAPTQAEEFEQGSGPGACADGLAKANEEVARMRSAE